MKIEEEIARVHATDDVTAVLVNPVDFWEMARRLEARVEVNAHDDKLVLTDHVVIEVGLANEHARKRVRVHSDPDCPRGVIQPCARRGAAP